MVERDPELLCALESLVDPATCGDPMSPLRRTCKSAAQLADELQNQGHAVSERTVNRLLHVLGYSLQSNRKTLAGGDHPDGDDQFEHLKKQPEVSVDAKKKELLGQYRNGDPRDSPKR